jgi:predicted nucleotidyltransferase
MAGTLAYLEETEKVAVHQFANYLVASFKSQVADIRLFGSKTRGDFGPDSDLDILIVLDNGDWATKDQIRFIASDVSLEFDLLLNTHILSRERWEELVRHQATLWREVQRDGVSLMPQSTDYHPERSTEQPSG